MAHEEDKKSEKVNPPPEKEEDKKQEQPKTRTGTLSFGKALDKMVKKKPKPEQKDCEEKED